MELIFKLDEISQAATQFLEAHPNRKVFAFHGEMGAGKTTFITALCKIIGVSGATSSPTFSIINQYDVAGTPAHTAPNGIVYHLDLYRLKDEEEAIAAGVEDVLYSGSICFVEWPDRAPGLFPADTLHVHLTEIEPFCRKISA